MSDSETEKIPLSSGLFTVEDKPVDGSLMAGLLDKIEEEYAPKTDTFDVVILIGGERVAIPFRRILDGAEMDELQKGAIQWARSLLPLKGKPKPMSPELRQWFVKNPEVLAKVYIVTRLAMHDDFKTEWKVMKLYRKAWPVFQSVVNQIDLAATNQIGVSEADEVEAEKKD